MNIGDEVVYKNVFDERCKGSILNVMSDMDSYEEMRLKDGVPLYYSKKLKKFVPVKPKNMESVFLEIFRGHNTYLDYVRISDVV